MRLATAMKATWKTHGSAHRAISAPVSTPSTIGAAHARRSPVSTADLRWCPRADLIEVGTMIASEVPTESGMRTASSAPRKPNSS
jgi:hypothetical protein